MGVFPGLSGSRAQTMGVPDKRGGSNLRLVSVVVLTDSGAYTVPETGVCIADLRGAGGGGGGGPTTGNGGGGGGAVLKTFQVVKGARIAYACGAPGLGVSDNMGTSGGDTTLVYPGVSLLAGGGRGGLVGPSTPGGVAVGGDINSPGGYGAEGDAPGGAGTTGAAGGLGNTAGGGGGAGGFTGIDPAGAVLSAGGVGGNAQAGSNGLPGAAPGGGGGGTGAGGGGAKGGGGGSSRITLTFYKRV